MGQEEAFQRSDQQYFIESPADVQRIGWQNRGRRTETGIDYGKAQWGNRHLEYMQLLRDNGFQPREIAEIGVADDARLVENILRVFPDAHVTVFEINDERIQGAKNTLAIDPSLAGRVSFVVGDAAETLRLSKMSYDLVDYQLLDQHITDTTLQSILSAVSEKLTPDGLLTTADLEFGLWFARAADTSDSEAVALARNTNEAIGQLRNGAYRRRGAHDWEGPREHAHAIKQLSGDHFVFDTKLSIPPRMVEFNNGDLEVELMANIVSLLTNATPELRQVMQGYIQGLQERRLIGSYPGLFQQTFRLRKV